MFDFTSILAIHGVLGAAATYVIVYALKQTPIVNNKWLPLISLIIGTVVGALFGLDDTTTLPQSILFGMAIGSGAVTVDQLYKHLIQK